MFPFCAIDFETTGSVPGFPNEPWQVGAVRVGPDGAFEPGGAAESLLRVGAGRPFNKWAPGRHGKLRAEIAAAPSLAEFWPRLAPSLGGAVAAHNCGTERSILAAAAPLHPPEAWIDTLALARRAWPSAPSHALQDLVQALGLQPRLQALCPGRAPHDALYDAFACALLLLKLLSAPAWAALGPRELARLSGA